MNRKNKDNVERLKETIKKSLAKAIRETDPDELKKSEWFATNRFADPGDHTPSSTH